MMMKENIIGLATISVDEEGENIVIVMLALPATIGVINLTLTKQF